jgi:hypothetical protein
MCRPETKRMAHSIAAALALAGFLGGCSDVYWDHRETVALSGGDAVAANTVTQVVDPWPPNSGNKTIPYNGQKMQVAVERYRNGAVIPPISAVTSDFEPPPSASAAPPASPSATQNASAGAPVSATAAQ